MSRRYPHSQLTYQQSGQQQYAPNQQREQPSYASPDEQSSSEQQQSSTIPLPSNQQPDYEQHNSAEPPQPPLYSLPFPPLPHTKLKPNYPIDNSPWTIQSAKPTNGMVNWYIVNWINSQENINGHELWQNYRDSFKEWTMEIYDIANRQALRNLRIFLMENGVFVDTSKEFSIGGALLRVKGEREQHVWTPEEIEKQLRYMGKHAK